MQYSKFVNTKAGQRGNAKKDSIQFPIFERSKNHNQFQKPPQAELERLTQEQAKTVELPKPILEKPLAEAPLEAPAPEPPQLESKEAKIHGSIDFHHMQKMEDLTKADEDWLAFFLGKKEPIVYSDSTEIARIPPASFADSEQVAPIIPPAPATQIIDEVLLNDETKSECLNNIFEEMISDDCLFSQNPRI